MLKLLILTFFLTACSCGTDRTREVKAYGKDVVEAVDSLVKNSAIFMNNNGFLLRMAYVATSFGEDKDTFTTKFNIWGLVQAKFDQTKDTKNNPNLVNFYAKINQTFGIDWNKVLYADMSKPLYGGLAVSLLLTYKPVPLYLEQQADYYNKQFSSSTTTDAFQAKVKAMEKLSKCFGRMDLAIVLDGSGSIGGPNFDLARRFVGSLVNTFSLDNVNIGLVVYSDTSTIVIPMGSNLSLADITNKIKSISYPGSGTNTSGAIHTATNMLLKGIHREGTPKIMAIFTDGAPNNVNLTAEASKQAINSKIILFAVGIGGGIDQTNLLSMVQNQSNRVFPISSYKSLSESFDMINTVTCKLPQKPVIGKEVNDTLIKDEKRFFCYDLPSIGITVFLEVKVGKTDAFYSYTQSSPSSALNDGILNGKTYIPVLPILGRSKRDTTSKRVCVTVEGKQDHNNFIINTEQGNQAIDNDNGDLFKIKKNAMVIAKNSFAHLKDYNQISNEVCNNMSSFYSKYQWICIVGQKIAVSEHQFQDYFFQFGFKIESANFYFIIKVPDN